LSLTGFRQVSVRLLAGTVVVSVSRTTTSLIHRLDLSALEIRRSRLQSGIAVARGFDVLS